MKFVLYTNALSEHQMPLAREIVKRIGAENFRYIYTGESSQKFQESHATEEWIVRAKEHSWLEEAEVMLVGGIRPIDLMERRAAKGLVTLYQSERWFKPMPLCGMKLKLKVEVEQWNLPGFLRMIVPSYRRMAKRFVKLVNENDCVKFLPIGPHAKRDFLKLGVRADKLVPWGYFVAPSENKLKCEVEQRKSSSSLQLGLGTSTRTLKVLWVGRDLAWKRVNDIEKAVALANNEMKCEVEVEQRIVTFTKLIGVTMSEVRAAMRTHDVYVLASDANEGWGAALNEALEEGMSAVGTFEAGASAAILPRERLYHAGDVKALARLLELEYLTLTGQCTKHEARSTPLPPCSIGDWTAENAAKRLLNMI